MDVTDNQSLIVDSPHYRGTYNNVYDAMDNVLDPTEGDYIIILGIKHFWNENRQSWGILENEEDQLRQMLEDFVSVFSTMHGCRYVGIADPTTKPIEGESHIFYVAKHKGKYVNFGDDIELGLGDIAFIKKESNVWEKDSIGTQEFLIKGAVTVGENGNWWRWNAIKLRYEDTGYIAGQSGMLDNDGNATLNDVEINGQLKVVEQIINDIKPMDGDYVFADGGYIEKVESVDEKTYKLYIRKVMPTDVATFQQNDILYSIISNKRLGGNDYYISWMQVKSNVNVEDNSILVVLYDDEDVPGKKNYPPQEGYNVARRGTSVLTDKERGQSWVLSSKDDRIMFLEDATKPELADRNYAVSVGKIPDMKILNQLPINTGEYGVVAKYGIFSHLYELDYNGQLKTSIVDRGEWSLATAQNEDTAYRYIEVEKVADDGRHTYTLLEQHCVWHHGCKWGCLKDKTTEEPFWNSSHWSLLEGNKNYEIEFYSDNGNLFRVNNVRLNITVRITYAGMDITDAVLNATGSQFAWSRDTGNEELDAAWKPNHVNDAPNVVNISRDDMGAGWGVEYKSVRIICQVYIPDGEILLEKSITARI